MYCITEIGQFLLSVAAGAMQQGVLRTTVSLIQSDLEKKVTTPEVQQLIEKSPLS